MNGKTHGENTFSEAKNADKKRENGARPRVVFTFVEAGMGHIIPMAGMCEAFTEKYGDRCEVVKSNIFSDSKYESVKAMGEKLSGHTKKTATNRLYNRFEAFSYMLPSRFTLFALDRYFSRPIKEFLSEYKALSPDLLVASYYLPAHLARLANDKKLTNSLIATYSPDSYIYPAWDRKCDLYLVNNEEAERQALRKGFDKDKVKRIPCVHKKDFTGNTLTKAQAREKAGIDGAKFTVLFTSGAYGAKNTYRLLRKIRDIDIAATLVVICGKNQSMQSAVREIFAEKESSVTLKLIGFTDDMATYIRAADVLIGKGGSNTVMEAAYIGCPMIMNACANELEEQMSKFCAKENIAVTEKNPDKAVELFKKLAADGDFYTRHVEEMKKFGDPTGAEKAADLLFELLKKRFPYL